MASFTTKTLCYPHDHITLKSFSESTYTISEDHKWNFGPVVKTTF